MEKYMLMSITFALARLIVVAVGLVICHTKKSGIFKYLEVFFVFMVIANLGILAISTSQYIVYITSNHEIFNINAQWGILVYDAVVFLKVAGWGVLLTGIYFMNNERKLRSIEIIE